MPAFKNILIGLENTKFDRTIIKYTDFISEICGVKKATFFNANIDLRMERFLGAKAFFTRGRNANQIYQFK